MSETETQGQKRKDVVVAKGSSPLWKIMSIIALAIAVISAVMMIVSTENNQQIQNQLTLQGENVQRMQASAQAMSVQVAQQQVAMQNTISGLDQLRMSNAQDPVTPVLVEVDYLLKLANYNAQYVGDIKTVLALLEIAEQRISGLSSPQLVNVRRALVANITALKGIKPLDVEGILLRLNALSDAIISLPVLPEAKVSAVTNSVNAPDSQTNQTWQDKLYDSLSELKKVIVVQRLNEPVQPLLSPEQHSNLVGNIQLKLEMAQWAVLHREPKVYSDALNHAKDWVGHYFAVNDMASAVITGLAELATVDVKPSLPDLSGTLALVDQEIKTRREQLSKRSPDENIAIPSTSAESVPSSAPTTNEPKEKSPEIQTPTAGPAPAAPLKVKPQNQSEPEVISS